MHNTRICSDISGAARTRTVAPSKDAAVNVILANARGHQHPPISLLRHTGMQWRSIARIASEAIRECSNRKIHPGQLRDRITLARCIAYRNSACPALTSLRAPPLTFWLYCINEEIRSDEFMCVQCFPCTHAEPHKLRRTEPLQKQCWHRCSVRKR